MTNPVLDASRITKRYGRSTAIGDFSISVEPGEIHGLLGPNGSGKTTSLHVLVGILRADAGSVSIGGEPIGSKRSRALLGFAPDDLPLPASLTGKEYIDFHDAMRSRDDRRRAAALVQALGMSAALDKQIAHYSHGMKRKIQVITALSHQPELLVLDEPFRGLDPNAAAVLRSMIRAFADSGRAVLIATHDLLRAERDCDRVTIIDDGAIVAAGAPVDLVTETDGAETLEDVFLAVSGLSVDRAARDATIHRMFDSIHGVGGGKEG